MPENNIPNEKKPKEDEVPSDISRGLQEDITLFFVKDYREKSTLLKEITELCEKTHNIEGRDALKRIREVKNFNELVKIANEFDTSQQFFPQRIISDSINFFGSLVSAESNLKLLLSRLRGDIDNYLKVNELDSLIDDKETAAPPRVNISVP